MDKDAKYVYIPDENGNDVKFEVIIYFEIEKLKGQYIIATPAFEQTDEAYAFKIFKRSTFTKCYYLRYSGKIIRIVSGLCLEIFLVQLPLITDKINFLFPLNFYNVTK